MKPKTLKALHAEWRKLSPNLAVEPLEGEWAPQAERRVRIAWANGKLHPKRLDKGKADITSFNQLSESEAQYLLKAMREESGDGPAYRATLIARLAVELFGHDWNDIVRERLGERFQLSTLNSLTAAQAHSMIEELLSRLARREGIEIEEVRKRLKGKG